MTNNISELIKMTLENSAKRVEFAAREYDIVKARNEGLKEAMQVIESYLKEQEEKAKDTACCDSRATIGYDPSKCVKPYIPYGAEKQ